MKRVSERMKTGNIDELVGIAEDFGRTQPVAFLGAAALAGFVASRFVLSSANRRQSKEATPSSPASTVATPRPAGSPNGGSDLGGANGTRQGEF